MTQRRCVEALFAGLLVAGVLLTPSPARALPPLPGDTDADGVSDQDEINIYHSDPNNRDTDGDRVNDGNEVNNEKSNPTSTYTDGDGLSDTDEYYTWHTMLYLGDTDQDGYTDETIGRRVHQTSRPFIASRCNQRQQSRRRRSGAPGYRPGRAVRRR